MDLLCRLTKRAWSGMSDSNRRPSDPKSDALPSCANSGWRWLEDSNFYRIINTTLVFETSLLPIRVNQHLRTEPTPGFILCSFKKCCNTRLLIKVAVPFFLSDSVTTNRQNITLDISYLLRFLVIRSKTRKIITLYNPLRFIQEICTTATDKYISTLTSPYSLVLE